MAITDAARSPPSAVTVLRNLAFYAVFYGGSVGFVLVAGALMLVAPQRLPSWVARWCRFHRQAAAKLLGIRVVVEGSVPPGPVLLALRHESFFEAIDLPVWLDRPAVFAKQELFRIPVWGRAAQAYGLIAVDRSAGARALRAMVRDATDRLAQNRPLVIFPEGTRMAPGVGGALGAGFSALYRQLAVTVVPVAVDSGRLYRQRWKRPGTIHYRIASPVAPGLDRATLEARVRDALLAPASAENV